jgi:hypothetical protein
LGTFYANWKLVIRTSIVFLPGKTKTEGGKIMKFMYYNLLVLIVLQLAVCQSFILAEEGPVLEENFQTTNESIPVFNPPENVSKKRRRDAGITTTISICITISNRNYQVKSAMPVVLFVQESELVYEALFELVLDQVLVV